MLLVNLTIVTIMMMLLMLLMLRMMMMMMTRTRMNKGLAGAGLVINKGRAYITGGIMDGNDAWLQGGALALISGSEVFMNGVIVRCVSPPILPLAADAL